MNIGELAKFRGGVSADTISELTSASGVTIDGTLLKDGSITIANTASYQTQIDAATTSFRIGRQATGTTSINIHSPNSANILGGFSDALVDLNVGSAGSIRINRSSPAGSYFRVCQSGTTTYNFEVGDSSIGTTPPITMGQNAFSGAALSTTSPARLRSSSATYTDSTTAASGTVSHGTVVSFDNPAIAATNGSVTYTSASTLYIDGAPTAGSNVTITNPYALYVASGRALFLGGIATTRSTITASATGSGAITVINNYHAVSGAGGAASTITTINGGIDGMMVVLKAVSDTVDIVFDTGGNLLLAGGAAFTLDTLNDTITFMYDSSLTKWLEIARSNNA